MKSKNLSKAMILTVLSIYLGANISFAAANTSCSFDAVVVDQCKQKVELLSFARLERMISDAAVGKALQELKKKDGWLKVSVESIEDEVGEYDTLRYIFESRRYVGFDESEHVGFLTVVSYKQRSRLDQMPTYYRVGQLVFGN